MDAFESDAAEVLFGVGRIWTRKTAELLFDRLESSATTEEDLGVRRTAQDRPDGGVYPGP